MPTREFRYQRMPTPQERFNALCRSFLEQANAINGDTPWRETEPKWWLRMQDMRQLALKQTLGD